MGFFAQELPNPVPGPNDPGSVGQVTPTPANPYTNRMTSVGRTAAPFPTTPAPTAPGPNAAPAANAAIPGQPLPVAQTLARSISPALNGGPPRGGFNFRRPTAPTGAAGTNNRTMSMAMNIPNRYAGTAFGGHGSRTPGSTGSFSRLMPKMGMG